MKYKHISLLILTVITLMLVSCVKTKPTMEYASGKDKDKIDLKGTLMKPDMRYVNIYAELVEQVVYVYFNEMVENCAMTLTAKNGDVLFARRVSKQQPATLTSPTGWTRPRAGSTSKTHRKSILVSSIKPYNNEEDYRDLHGAPCI